MTSFEVSWQQNGFQPLWPATSQAVLCTICSRVQREPCACLFLPSWDLIPSFCSITRDEFPFLCGSDFSLDRVQLSLNSPYRITVFLDKVSNDLENYEYAFCRFHTVLTEFRGSIFGELSGDSAGLKTSDPFPFQKAKPEQCCVYSKNLQIDMPEGKTRRKFPVFFSISISSFIFSCLQLMF